MNKPFEILEHNQVDPQTFEDLPEEFKLDVLMSLQEPPRQ
jgi:hypothetical protein